MNQKFSYIGDNVIVTDDKGNKVNREIKGEIEEILKEENKIEILELWKKYYENVLVEHKIDKMIEILYFFPLIIIIFLLISLYLAGVNVITVMISSIFVDFTLSLDKDDFIDFINEKKLLKECTKKLDTVNKRINYEKEKIKTLSEIKNNKRLDYQEEKELAECDTWILKKEIETYSNLKKALIRAKNNGTLEKYLDSNFNVHDEETINMYNGMLSLEKEKVKQLKKI